MTRVAAPSKAGGEMESTGRPNGLCIPLLTQHLLAHFSSSQTHDSPPNRCNFHFFPFSIKVLFLSPKIHYFLQSNSPFSPLFSFQPYLCFISEMSRA